MMPIQNILKIIGILISYLSNIQCTSKPTFTNYPDYTKQKKYDILLVQIIQQELKTKKKDFDWLLHVKKELITIQPTTNRQKKRIEYLAKQCQPPIIHETSQP